MSDDCEDCGRPRNKDEIEYYAGRCEDCERKAHEHREAWRLGKIHDPELDAFYSVSPTTPGR